MMHSEKKWPKFGIPTFQGHEKSSSTIGTFLAYKLKDPLELHHSINQSISMCFQFSIQHAEYYLSTPLSDE
jgi:hypothetical protein